MVRLQTSIAGLMAGVVFVALAIAALWNPSPLWASCLFLLAVTLMASALLGVIAGQQQTRLTCAGVAVFGWIYLILVFGPWKTGNSTTIPALPPMIGYEILLRERVIPPSQATDKTNIPLSLSELEIVAAYRRIVANHDDNAESLLDDPSQETPGHAAIQRVLRVMLDLRRIVHALAAILFAGLGGLLGRLLSRRTVPGHV